MKNIINLFTKPKQKHKSQSSTPCQKTENKQVNQMAPQIQINNSTKKINFISNLNSLSENKFSEFSTKITKDKNGLDYIFSSWRSDKHDKQNSNTNGVYIDEHHFSDLENTFHINLSLIKQGNNGEFNEEVSEIEMKVKKKEDLKAKLRDIKGKNLLLSLIEAEIMRKNEEMKVKKRNQILDLNEYIEGKLENKRSLEKKLKEYEKYIHKHSKLSSKARFGYLRNYNVLDFSEENTNLVEKKSKLNKENNELKKDIEELNEEKEINKKSEDNYEKVSEKRTKMNTFVDLKKKIKIEEDKKERLYAMKERIMNFRRGYKREDKKEVKKEDECHDKSMLVSYMNININETYVNNNISKIVPCDMIDISYIPKMK